jgi:uncharacterized damage-inducible protein DinB
MTTPFPSPTIPAADRTEVFLRYLDYYREVVLTKVAALPADSLRSSVLPSGWTPLELVKHLRFVEMRWLSWGFEGVPVDDPWGDSRDDRWFVEPAENPADLLKALREQGTYTSAVVRRHALSEFGAPSPRWDGAEPPELERILFHLLQEYARHTGHLDIVAELTGGPLGE